jgi:hypothetical protein
VPASSCAQLRTEQGKIYTEIFQGFRPVCGEAPPMSYQSSMQDEWWCTGR